MSGGVDKAKSVKPVARPQAHSLALAARLFVRFAFLPLIFALLALLELL